MLLICYAGCSTCRKAQAWLDAHHIPYDYRPIKEAPPSAEELRSWKNASGLPLKKFFNTSGMAYRALELSKKLPDMPEDAQYRLLSSDGMLVKRPILVDGDRVLVGFKEAEWEQSLCK